VSPWRSGDRRRGTVGVLALQGDFEAHAKILERSARAAREVRVPADLDGLDALILPGGESTVMTLGIEREGSPSRCARWPPPARRCSAPAPG
jgi:glutamine amidotransferase PdxT